MTKSLRAGVGGAVLLSLVCVLLAPLTLAEVNEKKFFKAIRKHDNKKVARYLERGVPDAMLLEGLALAFRSGSYRNAALIARHVPASDEALRLAWGRQGYKAGAWDVLMERGARFRDPRTLISAIEKGRDDFIEAVLEHGDGVFGAAPAIGVREVAGPAATAAAGRPAGSLTVETYEAPAGMTPLLLAVRNKDAELVTRLLDAGADPDAVVDAPGRVEGVDAGTLPIGERLTVDDPSRFTPPSRTTALIEAVRRQEMGLVTALLEAGASTAFEDGEGRDACAWATTFQRPGYLPTEIQLALCPKLRFIDAARHARVDEMTAYLDAGGDPNTANAEGWTALHAAATKGHTDAVELLIARGADVNRFMTEPSGIPTPLHGAAWAGQVEACRALIAAGADLEALNNDDETALLETTSLDVIRLLVEAGADIAAVDDKGRNAMTLANQRMDLAAVEFLRERGLSHGPGFATPAPEGDPGGSTSSKGYPVEGVLVAVQDGVITVRGMLSGDRVEDVACKLTSPVRDARYFHAPTLVDASVPKPRPLVTLTDDDLREYVGRIVRAGALKGECTWLSLPTAHPDDTAAPEQLRAALESAEYQGNVFNIITTGQMTTVFPGVLKAFRDQVVLVEIAGGLKVRCKLTGATGGILYSDDKTGTQSRLNSLIFERPEAIMETVGDREIRGHIGKSVKVGPGTGRCAHFEMVGFKKRR